MKIALPIKLQTTAEQNASLLDLQKEFAKGLNKIVPTAINNRCWNKVALHRLCYNDIRISTFLKSQMVCIAIRRVCDGLKTLKIKNDEAVPHITFKSNTSVHYDKRTYWFKKTTYFLFQPSLNPLKSR